MDSTATIRQKIKTLNQVSLLTTRKFLFGIFVASYFELLM